MAKYWASVVAQRVSGQAIEWAGGVGFTRETGIEKYWRDSKIVSLFVRQQRSSDRLLPASRALSTKGRPTSNYRLSPSLFRRNTHKNRCMDSTTIGANLYHISTQKTNSHVIYVVDASRATSQSAHRRRLLAPSRFAIDSVAFACIPTSLRLPLNVPWKVEREMRKEKRRAFDERVPMLVVLIHEREGNRDRCAVPPSPSGARVETNDSANRRHMARVAVPCPNVPSWTTVR
jgi:hypothetical protein